MPMKLRRAARRNDDAQAPARRFAGSEVSAQLGARRTSISLEPEFWQAVADVGTARRSFLLWMTTA